VLASDDLDRLARVLRPPDLIDPHSFLPFATDAEARPEPVTRPAG
jgi:hypothetical protein